MNLQKKNYEIITDELRRIIEAGLIKPNEKLATIDQLAAQYRVGRSTVREALSHLKALGLVESRQGGGTYVKKPGLEPQAVLESLQTSNAELSQLLQVRKILEVGAAELAAKHRIAEDVEELGKIIGQMRDAVGNEEISQIYDTNFHLAIARASGNAILETIMTHISAAMFRTVKDSRRLWLYSGKDAAGKLFEEHKKLFEAIRDGDSKTAVSTMAKHIAQVENALQSVK
ncbi:FadR/GntR family transcriptional regulator [Paenibacillus nasutitermitis]|uniref:HTH-type transcriptional regulator LutR n=1 Tax=Paenibacillus nasutitermitis TaxID=1652958 RepID=A0A916YSR8_9BACL|nr:FadR/GntR family transcriptional regulator [Paenibacillus nasutitermitis]GGD58856.1 HTH-type transcriptional regulator LutR [Paenibacillus nasutitermitis]